VFQQHGVRSLRSFRPLHQRPPPDLRDLTPLAPRPAPPAWPPRSEYGQYDIPTADVMINFKVGQPAESMLPLDEIRKAAAHKFAETDQLFLQYGFISGYPRFRRSLATFLSEWYKAPVEADNLFVTNGVTGGLGLYCMVYATAGETVFAEEPTYFLAKAIFADFGLNVVQIPMDPDGINIEALEAQLEAGNIPKFLYTIPTAHNPTGRTMSVAKRAKLVALGAQYGFHIIADEVYQLLTFPGVEAPPPLFTFDDTEDGVVISLGSFSKILAPALRLGWMEANPKILKKIFDCGTLDSSGGINPVIQGIVHSAIDLGIQAEYLTKTKQTLSDRYSALAAALTEHLPAGTTFEVPEGGYFVLVQLPEGTDSVAFNNFCQETDKKVMFLPGASFGASYGNFLRLSFSYYNAADMAVGAERLGKAITAFLSQ